MEDLARSARTIGKNSLMSLLEVEKNRDRMLGKTEFAKHCLTINAKLTESDAFNIFKVLDRDNKSQISALGFLSELGLMQESEGSGRRASKIAVGGVDVARFEQYKSLLVEINDRLDGRKETPRSYFTPNERDGKTKYVSDFRFSLLDLPVYSYYHK